MTEIPRSDRGEPRYSSPCSLGAHALSLEAVADPVEPELLPESSPEVAALIARYIDALVGEKGLVQSREVALRIYGLKSPNKDDLRPIRRHLRVLVENGTVVPLGDGYYATLQYIDESPEQDRNAIISAIKSEPHAKATLPKIHLLLWNDCGDTKKKPTVLGVAITIHKMCTEGVLTMITETVTYGKTVMKFAINTGAPESKHPLQAEETTPLDASNGGSAGGRPNGPPEIVLPSRYIELSETPSGGTDSPKSSSVGKQPKHRGGRKPPR